MFLSCRGRPRLLYQFLYLAFSLEYHEGLKEAGGLLSCFQRFSLGALIFKVWLLLKLCTTRLNKFSRRNTRNTSVYKNERVSTLQSCYRLYGIVYWLSGVTDTIVYCHIRYIQYWFVLLSFGVISWRKLMLWYFKFCCTEKTDAQLAFEIEQCSKV